MFLMLLIMSFLRAAIVNAQVQEGQNILITGIGGGVALLAMQICVAKGAIVYVTSGRDDKILKAVELGAKAGVNYNLGTNGTFFWRTRAEPVILDAGDWPLQIEKALHNSADGKEAVQLDAVIDSGGGNILGDLGRLLKPGGRLVCYGMYVAFFFGRIYTSHCSGLRIPKSHSLCEKFLEIRNSSVSLNSSRNRP
jgi:NADPH:quinone reductase-like Zn-dependent oxidoreductase